MTVLYLNPDNQTFVDIKWKLLHTKELPPCEPVAPAAVDPTVYDEIYCVIDMLRPNDYHPSRGWPNLQ